MGTSDVGTTMKILAVAVMSLVTVVSGCSSEPGARDHQDGRASEVLPWADQAFLNADIEVRRAKIRMEEPEEVFRLYVLDRAKKSSEWLPGYIAESRIDVIPVLREVVCDSTRVPLETASALGLLVSFDLRGSYDVGADSALVRAFLQAEARMMSHYGYEQRFWSESID